MDEYTIRIFQGATLKIEFTWENSTTGLPVDIDNTIITLELQRHKQTGTLVFDNDGNGGITILDGDNGIFELHITDEQTDLYTFSFGKYVIFVEFSNGEVYKYLKGDVRVEKKFQ